MPVINSFWCSDDGEGPWTSLLLWTPVQAQPEEQKRQRDPRAGQGACGRDLSLWGEAAAHPHPALRLLGSGSTDTIWGGLEQTRVVRQAGGCREIHPCQRSVGSLTILLLCFRVFSFLQGDFLGELGISVAGISPRGAGMGFLAGVAGGVVRHTRGCFSCSPISAACWSLLQP